MIKIEVDSTTFEERSGTTQKGKPYTIREQQAYAHVLEETGKPAKYPVKMRVNLEDTQPPYQPGFYTLDPRCVMVGDFDRLTLGKIRLVPIKDPAPVK